MVIEEPSEIAIDIDDITNADCSGNADGSATVTASGGTAPYDFAWSNGMVQVNMTTSTTSGLSAGGYTVTVTDANGCEAVKSITIEDPSGLELVVTDVTEETCGTTTAPLR